MAVRLTRLLAHLKKTNMPATNELLQEGRYRIGQPTPGRVNVFDAYDTVRNTNVVVREIPVKMNKVMTVSQQESLRLAFATQAKALTEIDHESLPHVHDFFSEIDRQYLVMETVAGEDLASLLSRHNRPFSVKEVVDWADQLLDALNLLHTHRPSIIHRNIRPHNINLDASGKIKLLGVGVGNTVDTNAVDDSANLRYSPIEQIWPGLDPASQKAITHSYDDRSERILKEPLDARSDIYSLGATLYFLVTGREPVDPLERSIDVLEGKLDPLREPSKVDSRIPAEISDVLMKALEIKRENRYDSAMIMRHVLKDAVARVQERETEEDLEQQEAAEIIRMATQPQNDPTAEEQKRLQAEAEQRRETEQKRLAEEQQRVEAERQLRQKQEEEAKAKAAAEAEAKAKAETEARAKAEAEAKAKAEAEARAEAESKARAEAEAKARAEAEAKAKQEAEVKARAEAEARAREEAEAKAREEAKARAAREEAESLAREEAEAEAAPTTNDFVLEIPAGEEVVAYRDKADIDEAELAAVLEELEEVEAKQSRGEESSDHVQVFEDALDMPAPSSAESNEDEDIFTVPEKSGSSLPMPAIAGAIGLVVVLAIGGWFMMSGSSKPEPPAPQPVQVSQPQSESNPSTESITSSTQTSQETAPSTEAPTDPQLAAKTAPTPNKAKKAETKPTAEKKKVTVDDLINDN